MIAALLGGAQACKAGLPATSAGLAPTLEPRSAPGAAVELAIGPDRVLVERIHDAQRVSCDLRLRNTGATAQTVRAIAVTALDASGAILSHRTIDDHGLAPAIATVPDRVIEPGQRLLMFNPLDLFPGDLAIAALRFELRLVDTARARTAVVATVPVHAFAPASRLEVPLDGNVLVAHGHGLTDPHRRLDPEHPLIRGLGMRANSARYAVDLTVVDDRGRMFDGDGSQLAQWKGYGAVVRAPAAGTVVFVVDGVPENRMSANGVEFAVDPTQPGALLGNVVAVEHLGGEVSLFAHLRAGSLRVKVGDRVAAGGPLGAIGFSGNLDFVHTHYQVVRRAAASGGSATSFELAAAAEGLPIYFHDFERVTGSRATVVTAGAIDTGEVIRRRGGTLAINHDR